MSTAFHTPVRIIATRADEVRLELPDGSYFTLRMGDTFLVPPPQMEISTRDGMKTFYSAREWELYKDVAARGMETLEQALVYARRYWTFGSEPRTRAALKLLQTHIEQKEQA